MTELPKAQEAYWEGIDGILVINLDRDTERVALWKKEMGIYLPAERIHWLSAIAGWELPGYGVLPWFTENTGERAQFWGGAAGCVLSHRKAIEKARAEGWKRVLILEDDAQLVPGANLSRLTDILPQLRGDYLCYLGCHEPGPYGKCLNRMTGLWEIEGALATHAYVLTEGMYDRLLAELPTEKDIWDWMSRHKAVDLFYRNNVSRMQGVKVYALIPNLIRQNSLPSRIVRDCDSIDPKKMYCIPKSLGGLRGIVHTLLKPLRWIQLYLNSFRTHRRALRSGLPGYKKHR